MQLTIVVPTSQRLGIEVEAFVQLLFRALLVHVSSALRWSQPLSWLLGRWPSLIEHEGLVSESVHSQLYEVMVALHCGTLL